MNITSNIQANQKQQLEERYKAFLSLQKNEKIVFFVLSVLYRPVGTTKLDRIVRELAQLRFIRGAVSHYKLTPARKVELVELGIFHSSSEGMLVDRILANKLVKELEFLESLDVGIGQNKLAVILHAGEQVMPVIDRYSWEPRVLDKGRLLRDFYVLGEMGNFEKQIEHTKDPNQFSLDEARILVEMFFLPFEPLQFDKLNYRTAHLAFAAAFRLCLLERSDIEYLLSLLKNYCARYPDNLDCQALLAEYSLYTMHFDESAGIVHQIIASGDKASIYYAQQIQGAQLCVNGQFDRALEAFNAALHSKNKVSRRKKQFLTGLCGYLHKLTILILAAKNDASYFDTAFEQLDNQQNVRKDSDEFTAPCFMLQRLGRCLSKNQSFGEYLWANNENQDIESIGEALNVFTLLIGLAWCNQGENALFEPGLEKVRTKYVGLCRAAFEQMGLHLFATLANQFFDDVSAEKTPESLVYLPNQVTPKALWEHALEQLLSFGDGVATSEKSAAEQPDKRLIWQLESHRFADVLTPREQKRGKQGWGKGRPVSLKRLYDEYESYAFLSDKDIEICRAIERVQSYDYYSKTEYVLEGLGALSAACHAENLYLGDDIHSPIELVNQELELLVSQQIEHIAITLSGVQFDDEHDLNMLRSKRYVLTSLSPSRFGLIQLSDAHVKLLDIIGPNGIVVPLEAKQRALKSISAIAPVLNIQSDMADLDTGLTTLAADTTLYINVEPVSQKSAQNQGLSFTCNVMPLGESGPSYVPGIGSISVSAEIDGQRVATERDLLVEQNLLYELDECCPAFLSMSSNTLVIDDIQLALATLEQLEQAIKDNQMALLLRWPKGKKLKLSEPLGAENMQLALAKKRNEWFDIGGDLVVDDEQVVPFKQLLSLLSKSGGRFVQLDEQRFLALTDDLRKRLAIVENVTDEGEFHPLASLKIQEATTGMRMKTLHAWEAQTERMHQANTIEPNVPSTLQAELRDYQLEGFDWMMRLAHWGAGACLADDMGLGKTLQALAVMLARAEQGASLVIAPTSVCFNWRNEIAKFAPTLNVSLLSDVEGTSQREALIRSQGPFDCLIVSYGLLQRENELFESKLWHTLVADEAQALKNPLAKRTKAACALKADFRIITTGTPIENDLSELWSLFRFVNPGLLGNLKRFTTRFIQPIENAKEDKLAARKASQSLKALTQPFILRRLKSQVLEALPSRTDITLSVSLSEQERAFYEALRQHAVEVISHPDNTANTGEQRIKMLAELVKLRQACCHAKLVMPESQLPSAKLSALDQLLDELLANHHKALIFSQFVGHLKLIQQHLDKRGIQYQYLDGTTPNNAREKRVQAFQKGEGDVFLISLKAGGVGLNLTAADYVIHMDPWWNPAVEDQASDRAHRMGQTRPVTIYRIVAKDTIEERIVSLHHHKRDLADKLLAGTDQATRLSVEDMLVMLKDTF